MTRRPQRPFHNYARTPRLMNLKVQSATPFVSAVAAAWALPALSDRGMIAPETP